MCVTGQYVHFSIHILCFYVMASKGDIPDVLFPLQDLLLPPGDPHQLRGNSISTQLSPHDLLGEALRKPSGKIAKFVP